MGNWKARASAASVIGACVFALLTGAGAVFAGDWWGQHHGPVVVQFINGPAGDAKAKQSDAGRVHARRSPALDKSTVPAAGPENDVNKPYPQTSQVSPAPLRATARAAPRMAPCGSTMAETGPTMVQAGASAPVRTVCTSSPAAPSSAPPSSAPPSSAPPSSPPPSSPPPSSPEPSYSAPSSVLPSLAPSSVLPSWGPPSWAPASWGPPASDTAEPAGPPPSSAPWS
jgi:hypothetical protein